MGNRKIARDAAHPAREGGYPDPANLDELVELRVRAKQEARRKFTSEYHSRPTAILEGIAMPTPSLPLPARIDPSKDHYTVALRPQGAEVVHVFEPIHRGLCPFQSSLDGHDTFLGGYAFVLKALALPRSIVSPSLPCKPRVIYALLKR